MTAVVLITPDDVAAGTPEGLCAAAFAAAYAGRGHRVHLLCGFGQIPRPGYSCDGSVTVQRLPVRRGSPGEAFSVDAVRTVHELIRRGRCHAIECVGGSATIAGLAGRRSLTGCGVPIVSLEIEPGSGSPGADAVFSMHGEAAAAFPIAPGVWTPPACDGPVFAVCDAAESAAQAPILDAYRESGAGDAGWSLAMLAPGGKWNILAAKMGGGGDSVCVTLTAGPGPAVAAVHGLTQGCACLVGEASPGAPIARRLGDGFVYSRDEGSLAGAMRMVAGFRRGELEERASAGFELARVVHDAGSVVGSHERAWAAGAARWDRGGALRVWRSLEHGLVC